MQPGLNSVRFSLPLLNKKIFSKKRLSWFVNIKFRALKCRILFDIYCTAEVYFYAVFYFHHHLFVHWHCVLFRAGLCYEKCRLKATTTNGPPFRDLHEAPTKVGNELFVHYNNCSFKE